MTENYPINPPPELIEQWYEKADNPLEDAVQGVATRAARWGADQELEACCAWLQDPDLNVDTYKLRAARRPKPPSLAEQALEALKAQIDTSFKISSEAQERANTIRTALERLKELEQNG